MPGGLKRKFSRAISKYVTPQNVKRAKQAIVVAKSGKRIVRAVKRTIRKQQAKRRGYVRTQLRENSGDIGIHTSKTIFVRTPTAPYKPNASKYWHTFENAATFSFASSTGTVPGTNQLNRQKVFELASYGVGTSLQALQSTIVNSTTAAFVSLNMVGIPNQVTGSLVYQGIKGSFEFTNQEQSNLMVTIYMCVANGNFGTYTATDVTWDASLDENAGNARTPANVNAHMPDAEPGGEYFKSRWKILKKQRIYMAAGVTQKHYFSHVCNKVIPISHLTDYQMIKDVTLSFLVTMRGTPVDFDAVQTHGPATLIGYAPSKIVGVAATKYTFKTVPIEFPKINYQNNGISGTAPTVVYEMNDEDGKPVNIFAATNAA